MREFTVVFRGQDKKLRVSEGTDILNAAAKCGLSIHASCGGEGTCGKCKVIIEKGKVRDADGRVRDGNGRDSFLACQTLIVGDAEIRIPQGSLEVIETSRGSAEEYTKGSVLARENTFKHLPLIQKKYLQLSSEQFVPGTDAVEVLYKVLDLKDGGIFVSTKLAQIRQLDEILQASEYKITVTLGKKDEALEIVSIEPGDSRSKCYGIAFDIGTTTVVGQLVDLNTKQVLASRIAFNKQAIYGSDVISRIIYASQANGLKELNTAVVSNMNEIIQELLFSQKVTLDDIYGIACAGNMTMMHLLLGIDPAGIRKAPYMPEKVAFPASHTSEIGIGIHPHGVATFLPGVSTYIGGDIVAGVLACGLSESPDLTLLIDIGTNGEVVLGNNEWMIGTAASAGPAFEGSGLASGTKAVAGAIQKVVIGEDLVPTVTTIGSAKPKGICGSGYIDLLCQMLKRGIITKDGKIDRELKSPRIRRTETNYEYVIVFKSEAGIDQDIVIQDDDIENLKRAKGAIYSAVIALVNKVGQSMSDVKKLYIAGGFGNYLNIENAIRIGLLPDLDRSVYEFIGNSSLAGARMALLSQEALAKTHDIYKKITYLDLSSEPGYMDEYVAALFFPHTDMGRFPSVR